MRLCDSASNGKNQFAALANSGYYHCVQHQPLNLFILSRSFVSIRGLNPSAFLRVLCG